MHSMLAFQRSIRLILVLLLLCAALLIRPAMLVHAQGERCFGDEAPGVTACIEGRFLTFWEANGGLAVFGYPLTDVQAVRTTDGTFLTQYFERARFELHPENERPYDVLLGRLGVELLRSQGEDVGDFPSEPSIEGCQFWAETQHNVCGSFLTAWESWGVQLDNSPALTDSERLALWGLPVTSPIPVTTDAGVVLTQWFERARFEQQPDGRVTFGLLGSEILGTSADEPTPPSPTEPTPPPPAAAPPPPSAPSAPPPSIPCNINVPTPVEGLQVWMTDPTPSRRTDAVACVRLIVNGNAVNGAQAMTYRYIGDERRPSIPQSTGFDGVASFIFYIGEEASNVAIPVEAVVTYQGVTYVKYTAFTPQ